MDDRNSEQTQQEIQEALDKAKGGCLALLLMLILQVPLAIYGGFVLSKLWFWFMVPLGLQPISIVLAIGINLLVTYIVYLDINTKKNQQYDTTKPVGVISYSLLAVVFDSLFLFFGWIVSLFL